MDIVIDIVNDMLEQTDTIRQQEVLYEVMQRCTNIYGDIYKITQRAINTFEDEWDIKHVIEQCEGYLDSGKYWVFNKKVMHNVHLS